MRRGWLIVVSVVALLLVGCASASWVLFSSAYKGDEEVRLFIRTGEQDSLPSRLSDAGVRTFGLRLLTRMGGGAKPGMYIITKGQSITTIYKRLRSGRQDPVQLTLPSLRTTDALAAFLSSRLMLDSAYVSSSLQNALYTDSYGYTPETVIALFIPNTYEVYWNVSLDDLMSRMRRENILFWNVAREAKAKALGMTHVEVATLASIVDEETNDNGEKPTIAGMYINRLKCGMPLQADPTVKFAVGDFSLRRLLNEHLQVESPYNTYLHEGLPPGPIRMPSVAGIDAVLDYTHSNYLYMCAKEDFSGTHRFAATYQEHLSNARRYRKALDQRGIR
ncbi:MAG: endolytic transglycosylase MltG [Prevotellaceae bacterium]|nr:endolytic transglycosylase MltG [Prevotellaceae bacterium]